MGQVIGRNGRRLKGLRHGPRATLPAMSGSRETVLARIGPVGPSDLQLVGRIAAMALAAIHREYPSHVSHLLRSDADARPPRELTPTFYGCFDWHSAVHGHWCLARLARLHPEEAFAGRALEALAEGLTRDRIAREVESVSAPGREGFERPYGLAWLLQLAAELREWSADSAPRIGGAARVTDFHAALAPLESLAAERIVVLVRRLPWPVRAGVHSQTAFALGLAFDWTRAASDRGLEALIAERARAWFGADVGAPVAYEPSGHDFLSPILGEADLMRRVLPRDEFGVWLARFLPDLESAEARRWLTPVKSPDPADGHLAHLDGLNLSRAWMLEGIASALAADDPRAAPLRACAARHAADGLAALRGEHYAGTHWLGSFAAYLLTGRGLSK